MKMHGIKILFREWLNKDISYTEFVRKVSVKLSGIFENERLFRQQKNAQKQLHRLSKGVRESLSNVTNASRDQTFAK